MFEKGRNWWLGLRIAVVLVLSYGENFAEGDRNSAVMTRLREPRMSYIAKIIEDKNKVNKPSILVPVSEQAAAEDVSEESGQSGDDYDSSQNTEEEDAEVVGPSGIRPETRSGMSPKQSKFVEQRSANDGRGHNWYVYNSDKKGRAVGRTVETGDGSAKEGGEKGNPKGAGGFGQKDAGESGGLSGGNGVGGKEKEIAKGGGGKVNGTGGFGGKGNQTAKGGGGKVNGTGGLNGNNGQGNWNGTGGSTGSNKPKPPKVKPYNVVRARPADQVDPNGYNFFQSQPKSKLGWLWMAKSRRVRENFTDEGPDDDDEDPANKFDWEFRRYDRACLYLEYKKRRAQVEIPLVQEEVKQLVDLQNEKLARKFIHWQFEKRETSEDIALGERGQDHPHVKTFKFLQKIVSIFTEKICRNAISYAKAAASFAPFGEVQKYLLLSGSSPDRPKPGGDEVIPQFLPPDFVENLFNLFLVLRNLTLSNNVKDFPTKEDEELLFDKILTECSDEGQSIPWFAHSCGDQLLSYERYNNYACTPFMEHDFDVKKYDPILDTIWHIFNAVHSYCYQHFLINIRTWHKFAMIISNSFTPEMRLRWKASVAPEGFYMRLLGPGYPAHLDTINRCTFGATLRSDSPLLLPRFGIEK